MIELYWVGFHGTSRNRAWLKKQSYFVQIPLSNTTSIPRQQNLWIFLDWFNWFWGSDAEFDPLGFSDTFDIKWLREILGAESSIGQRDSENSERHFWASQSAREKVQKNISNVGFHLESEAWFELKILKNNGPMYDNEIIKWYKLDEAEDLFKSHSIQRCPMNPWVWDVYLISATKRLLRMCMHRNGAEHAEPTHPRAELKHGRVCMLETWLIKKPPKGHSLGQGLIAVPQQDLIFVYYIII